MTREKLTAPFRLLLLAALTLALSSVVTPAPIRAQTDPFARPPSGSDQLTSAGTASESFDDVVKPINAMIELTDEPAVVSTARARARGLDAAKAGREQRVKTARAQSELLGRMRGASVRAQVLYQVQSAYNGIAVLADGAALNQIRALPGVKAVRRLALLERDNAATVPLIGAPKVWEQLSNSVNLTGRGLRVGIIDTGVDYVHTNFGGTGTAADLNLARGAANNPPASAGVVPPGFAVSNGSVQLYPSAKVVGGYDFAGDAYNADSTSAAYNPIPAPDPNPIDCPSTLGGGHGSHVAGTVAGYGVKADGSTYTGPWNTSTPFGSLRIGPGVAPEAQLYALRVFGCGGSTALTTLAIDWSVDPNRDGDTSDHLDVINMSLGSGYGTPDDPSASASENAAAAGVVVVASAGNSGDLFYISGSPGSSTRTVTVASSVDDTDVVDGFDVLSPASIAGVYGSSNSIAYNYAANPPTSAPLVYPNTNRDACSSFAAGSLTGKVVLIDWILAGQTASACGSAARVTNARAGGAVGVIMSYNLNFLDTAISGAASIPATLIPLSTGNLLKSALSAGAVQVRLGGMYTASAKIVAASRIDTLSTFSSRGPRNRDNALKPDISAPGQTVFSTDAGTGTLGRSLSGTSMAAPHMAGVMALLKQQNPTWTVEELKALAMNTAGNDLYSGYDATAPTAVKFGPARVGAGRVQVDTAIANRVVAYNADVPGAVSISFGAVEVPGTLTLTRNVRVVNKGTSDASFTLSYDARTSIPGVSYSFPDGASVTVPAGGATTFRVQLSADASLMKHSRDTTIDTAQSGYPRQWLSEASGLIKLTPASGPALRVPVYASARPVSAMSTAQSAVTLTGASFSAPLALTGRGVGNGVFGPTEHNSLVTPFELQGVSPKLDAPPAGAAPSSLDADLQYIGVTANASSLYFGLTTWRDFATLANDVQFSIYIDRNGDGVDDLQLFNTRISATDVFVTALATLPSTSGSLQAFTNIYNANIPTAALNNNVVVLPVNIASLGMPAGRTRISYRVETYSSYNGVIDTAGPFTFDFGKRGFDFTGGASTASPVYLDQPGNNVPLVFSQANYLANNSQGALLLHHYNLAGTRAQVLPVVAQVTINAPTSVLLGQPPFAVSASASTGQSVAFSSLTPSVCSVSGGSVTTLAVGTCTIRASTVATANYGVASADATIQVLPQPAATFDSSYTALCQAEPGLLTVTGRVTLPQGMQAKVQTVWYITEPSDQRTTPVYQISDTLQDGDTFSVQVSWPGIRPDDKVVATFAGATLLDPVTLNPIPYSRGASKSFYWYPWVCPAPQP